MSTELQILKGTKLITNTKKQIKILEQRLDSQNKTKQNTTLLKIQNTKSITKIIKNIYLKFALKLGPFFGKVIIGYTNEN